MTAMGKATGRAIWLIFNSASSSTSPESVAVVEALLAGQGWTPDRKLDLATDSLPEVEALVSERPAMIVSFGGDGTANAVIETYGEASGTSTVPLLVLPGGTMNLLSAKLHGDAPLEEIIRLAGQEQDRKTIHMPRIEGPGICSLVGIIAGPTSAWGEVRENLRRGDVASLSQGVPRAIQAMWHGPRVMVEGVKGSFPALFVEAERNELVVHAIHTESWTDLLRHGVAWMMRDFLGGPTEELRRAGELTLRSKGRYVRMLVDGEPARASAPLTLRAEICPAQFIATIAKAEAVPDTIEKQAANG